MARCLWLLRRFWPIPIIALVLVVAVWQGWGRYLSIEFLQEQRSQLTSFVAARPIMAAVVFLLSYALVTACMVPGAFALTVSGGFLFGLVPGALMTLCAATIGASCLFLAARSGFSDILAARAGPFMQKLEQGFARNAISYMLVLRFIPVVPFGVANIAPALLGARLRDFVLTTFFGVMPGVIAYAWIGAGLGEVFDARQTPDLSLVAWKLAPAFAALALLALLPVLFRAVTGRR